MLVVSTPGECGRAAWKEDGPCPFVVTIGNFDGVHLGHQALISRTVRRARQLGLLALAVTFDPHPAGVLTGRPPRALASTEQRLEIMDALGVDVALVLPFTRDLAAVPARDFCRKVLVEALDARVLFIGYDFSLGCDRAGPMQLTEIGQELGFDVMHIHAVMLNDAPISSTRIRNALAAGDLELANAMLGRPHAVRGMVVHGAGRGGPLLGVPTANMELGGVMLPQPAIYATTARVATGAAQSGAPAPCPAADRGAMPAVTSFGRNPTFAGGELTLETHILDFSADIYGEVLEVAFLKKLRQERKFAGPEALIAQLRADIEARRGLCPAD